MNTTSGGGIFAILHREEVTCKRCRSNVSQRIGETILLTKQEEEDDTRGKK